MVLLLYSAKYNFLFSKSGKTGSTSAEAALEYLITKKHASHLTNSLLLADGSRIGFRGADPQSDPSYNTSAFSLAHQTLSTTREFIGTEKFDCAFKISSIRNPYDMLISAHHHLGRRSLTDTLNQKLKGKSKEIKHDFFSYIQEFPNMAGIYFYHNKKMIIDKFIRIEKINEGIAHTLALLKIPSNESKAVLENIPNFKMTNRKNIDLSLYNYYSVNAIKFVSDKFRNWFSLGGYIACNSINDLRNY